MAFEFPTSTLAAFGRTEGQVMFDPFGLALRHRRAVTSSMARKLRHQFEGALHPIINRGNYRQNVFERATTAKGFDVTLDETGSRHGWRHAVISSSVATTRCWTRLRSPSCGSSIASTSIPPDPVPAEKKDAC